MTPKLPQISSAPGTKYSYFTRFWREPHRQAAQDFRTRWLRCGLWLLLGAWFALLLVCLIWLSSPNPEFFGSLQACLPDGSFAMDPSTSNFRYLSGSGFFQITMGLGSMNFTQVKAIDICWDIFVGRGGQALIAYISWRIFAKYVTTSMEVTPVTFGTYRTIFLPNAALFFAIPRLIRDFVTRHGLHSKIAMVFMVYTMAFTFVYPTLASAMTGYSANVEAFVRSIKGDYVPLRSFSYVFFVIHDGSRIGLSEDHVVTGLGPIPDPGYLPDSSSSNTLDWDFSRCYSSWYAESYPADCEMQLNVSKYAVEYGLDGKNMTNSTFWDITLLPPVLNISAPFLRKIPDDEGRGITRHSSPFQAIDDTSRVLWAYDNQFYNLDYLAKHGQCQAISDYYWGWSYVQLFIMLILHLVWTSGLYIMWLRADMTMKKRGRGKEDVAGEHKAVFELAAAMREQMNEPTREEGDDVSTLTEAKLRRRIAKDLRGGSISYTTPLLPNGESGDDRITKAWIKSHKLSIFLMVACFMAAALSAVLLPPCVMSFFALPVELGIALYVGSTRKSRIVLFVWTLVAVSFLVQIPIYTVTAYGGQCSGPSWLWPDLRPPPGVSRDQTSSISYR